MPFTLTPTVNTTRLPMRLALLALLFEAAHLTWEHLHGGIATHHFMRNSALPGFSNAWGLLLLPLLAAWAGLRIEKRLAAGTSAAAVVVPGMAALLAGLAVATALSMGWLGATNTLFFTTLALAVVLPACRAECWLGWVLGMAFAVGAVIPAVIGAVVLGISAVIHLALKPRLVGAWAHRAQG